LPIIGAAALAVALQGPDLTFAGIGLRSELDSVAVRFPHSQRAGDYLYVAPEDSREHISVIGISGSGDSRRVRISFERRREPAGPEYPTCAAVQAGIARRFGRPDSIRTFTEEATERSDRLWRRGLEALTLVCFRRAPGARLWAEAVVLEPRPRGNPGR
jgi:hypothetical protein